MGMQVDRMFKIVYMLLDKKMVTAQYLAEAFEVSVRTIYRDIEALSVAGIPIYAASGKGGGYALMDNFVLNKSALTEDEQNHILMALQSFSAVQNFPAGADGLEGQSFAAGSNLAKMKKLPAAEKSDVGATLDKISALFRKADTAWIEVDYSHWGNLEGDKEKFETLKQAILQKRRLKFYYYDSWGQGRERIVEPVKLVFKGRSWYLQAVCCYKEAYRTYKISRMDEAVMLKDTCVLECGGVPEIDPAEDGKDQAEIILQFKPGMAYRIYDEFSPREVKGNEDGSFTVRARMPVDQWLVGYLLSFGTGVSILAPESLQRMMEKEISQLYYQYMDKMGD